MYCQRNIKICNPQPTFLPQFGRPDFTPIQNSRQNFTSVYRNIYILFETLETKIY